MRQAVEVDVKNLVEDSPHKNRPVWYVAEMEPPNINEPDSVSRYVAYKKSGFRMIDDSDVIYHQLNDPVTNLGKPMQLMVARGLAHAPSDAQDISRTHLCQILEALKYSYTSVGYQYNENTEPKIVHDAENYTTREIPISS